jgi:hypothetical protein
MFRFGSIVSALVLFTCLVWCTQETEAKGDLRNWLEMKGRLTRENRERIIQEWKGETQPTVAAETKNIQQNSSDHVATVWDRLFGELCDYQTQLDAISRSHLSPSEAYKRVFDLVRNRTMEIIKLAIENDPVDMAQIDESTVRETKLILHHWETYKNMEKYIQRIQAQQQQRQKLLDELHQRIQERQQQLDDLHQRIKS